MNESVSAVTANQPPRSLYAGLMLAAGAVASICAFAAANAVGSENAPALQTASLIFVVSMLGLLPVLVRKAEYFGMAVLGASVARMLLAMFAALILTEVGNFESRPVWLGVVTGAGLMLLVESTAAIAILMSMERKKADKPVGVESSSTC
ncbi:MAG: hypothetical protein KDA31_07915 [Phycisphaerales bacterium]|nr:hypothetical protein [Phycisphaerales bacterium]MCB9836575.1 hypothetical protein [Phycisphaera sp.]